MANYNPPKKPDQNNPDKGSDRVKSPGEGGADRNRDVEDGDRDRMPPPDVKVDAGIGPDGKPLPTVVHGDEAGGDSKRRKDARTPRSPGTR
jgi:hypothetical protein